MLSEESSIEWEVDEVLQIKYLSTGTEYLIKWKNSNDHTWEPKKHLIACKEALRRFKSKFPAAISVKDMQKQLPLPKFSQQPSDYYRKVHFVYFLLIFSRENYMYIILVFIFATQKQCIVMYGMSTLQKQLQVILFLPLGVFS